MCKNNLFAPKQLLVCLCYVPSSSRPEERTAIDATKRVVAFAPASFGRAVLIRPLFRRPRDHPRRTSRRSFSCFSARSGRIARRATPLLLPARTARTALPARDKRAERAAAHEHRRTSSRGLVPGNESAGPTPGRWRPCGPRGRPGVRCAARTAAAAGRGRGGPCSPSSRGTRQ